MLRFVKNGCKLRKVRFSRHIPCHACMKFPLQKPQNSKSNLLGSGLLTLQAKMTKDGKFNSKNHLRLLHRPLIFSFDPMAMHPYLFDEFRSTLGSCDVRFIRKLCDNDLGLSFLSATTLSPSKCILEKGDWGWDGGVGLRVREQNPKNVLALTKLFPLNMFTA